MPVSSSALRKRLAKVKRQMAEKARLEKLVNCNCRLATRVHPDGAEEFEAEMNLQCPGHGFRSLGIILILRPYKSTVSPDASNCSDETCQNGILKDDETKIDALIDIYWQRYRQHVRRVAQEESDEF